MKLYSFILFLSAFIFTEFLSFSQNLNVIEQRKNTLTPELLGMPRQEINFSDRQLRLFNGRGCIYPKQYSLTGLHKLQFPPIDVTDYQFRFDIIEGRSKKLIQDNVPELWKEWIEKGQGSDPLGCNFRPGFATVLVTQDEYWQPNSYFRSGTFHKKYEGEWTTFGIETKSSVSARDDEIYLEIKIANRDNKELTLTLVPEQYASVLKLQNGKGSSKAKKINAYTIGSEQMNVYVVSDISTRIDSGWELKIPGSGTMNACFAIILKSASEKEPSILQPDLRNKIFQADLDTRNRLQWMAERLPVISSSNKKFDDFYRRCILTMAECKWERKNFILNPFWSCGTWVFTMTWDNSFSADVLTMLDPESMRQSILTGFTEGQLKRSYIAWHGGTGDIPYIQDPFASQILIDEYIRITGDSGFLDYKNEGVSILDWMKRWGNELHDKYGGRPDGLIDMGEKTDKLVEIRTDGYSHIVPVVNGLTIKLYKRLSEWCRERNDPDAELFTSYANQLSESFHKKLWNEKDGWFDNLFPNGKKESVWTYHLFDLIGTDIISEKQRNRLISHIKEGEFLGKFGMYSISKRDRIHWDLIDADWGGGGQFPGMTLRIAEYLYSKGYSELGWNILKRFIGYIDYFPYIPQNPRTDRPEQDESSMPLQISAGAGIQTILFGIFGLQPNNDGSLEIFPTYHNELGIAKLTDFKFRGNSYDIEMNPGIYRIFQNGKPVSEKPYGEKTIIGNVNENFMVSLIKIVDDPVGTNHSDQFVKSFDIGFTCKTPDADIRYTTNGSEPTLFSPKFESGIKVEETTNFKVRAFKKYFEPSRITEISLYKQVLKDKKNPENIINRMEYPDIRLSSQPSQFYTPKNGQNALMDGIFGSISYNDGQWLGYEGIDFESTIDLKNQISIKKISASFLRSHPVWIFLPSEIKFSISNDGKNYERIKSFREVLPGKSESDIIKTYAHILDNLKARFIRIKAANLRVCPEWHIGAGSKSWIFIDEVIIE